MLSRMRPARALATRAAAAAEEFATGTSSAYADAQYLAWQRDPASVHSSWASYFASGAFALPPQLGARPPPARRRPRRCRRATRVDAAGPHGRGHGARDAPHRRVPAARPRARGPGPAAPRRRPAAARDLDPATYGFEPGDADRPLRLASAPGSAVAGCVEINQCVGCTPTRRFRTNAP